VKVYLMCGVSTKIVSSVEVSGWTVHDTNHFIPLVEETAKHFHLREVAADKAYLGRKNLHAVEATGATPFVPFKSNTLPPAEDSTWARMYHSRRVHGHYRKRSNIESAFSMMKGKFGDSVRSKSDTGQINEALCKVLCHNVCVLVRAIHDLGLEPTFGSRATSDSSDYLEPKLFA
jgi:Transposase DDE domain